MERIVFLHVPKTAGQSVHAALVDAFGASNVCPARVNDELQLLTIEELNRYRVYSGHFDWSMLDCIDGPKYVFTVLRRPLDRVLSFYFFLRDEGLRLSEEQRQMPSVRGLVAASELSAHEFFTGGSPEIRGFLDEHFDNFYSYYFASRHYRGRSVLRPNIDASRLTEARLCQMASANLGRLDAVHSVERIDLLVESIFRRANRVRGLSRTYRNNVNESVPGSERLERFKSLGATELTLERVREFCRIDDMLFDEFVSE